MDCEMGAADSKPVEFGHALSTPLLQIFSVYVHTNSDDEPCEVYGSIRATEEKRDWSVDLYNRGITEAETIMKYGSLSLIGPKDDAILGTTKVTLDICLIDRTRGGTELIKAKHCLWDPETEEIIEDSYDKLRTAVIYGEHGCAHVYYTTFQFAVSALVEFRIIEKTDGSSRSSDVYGSVVASYENSRRYCSSSYDENELNYLKTVLFDKPSDEPVRMMVGAPPLNLRSVAIPAYSSLIIGVDLFDSQGQLASCLEEFLVDDYGRIDKCVQSEIGCIQVTVIFKNAYRKMYGERKLQKCTTIAVAHKSTQDMGTKTEEPSENFQDLPEHKLTSLEFNDWRSMPQTETANGLKSWGGYLAEVFSVHIGGINREISALCGTIEVYDGDTYYIYKKDWKNNCETIEDDSRVEVGGPINDCTFILILDLKDPLQNLEISRGEFAWCDADLERHTFLSSVFNKRICSVVRGADGYAALHYMLFAKAARAIIEVTFSCDKPAGVKTYLYGLIHASYGGHKYSTAYERRYYRSRLFDRPYCRPAQVKAGSKVPLSKLAVAVHTKSSLVIDVNLVAIDKMDDNSHGHGDAQDVLDDRLEFVVDRSCTVYKDIWSAAKSCRILVSVRFEEP